MQRHWIVIILHLERIQIMVLSSSHIYSKGNLDVVKTNTAKKTNVKKFSQNGQIQIYQSSYRGSYTCLLYTSPSPRDRTRSRMPSSA